MPEIQWFRAYVEQILAAGWDQCRVEADQDGDYVFRFGTAACLVRIEKGPPLGVRVIATAATGVRRTAKLLTELNELNAAARAVSTFWHCGSVYVDRAIDAPGVNAQTLMATCSEVGTAADMIGALIAGVFDGATPFAAVGADDEPA